MAIDSQPASAAPPRRSTARPEPTARAHALLPVALLGKLATTDIRPAVVLAETALLPMLAIALGLLLSPQDPLWTDAAFSWAWLAPVILALRYGPLPGLGGTFVLLAGWLLLHTGDVHDFPQVHFLGGFILVMLVGEFSSLWQARTRRAEINHAYVEQRLEHLVRQYYLLRLSHDRLEQELIGRPMSMRDALAALHDVDSSEAGAQAVLRLLAQYCQLESAALYSVHDDQLAPAPLAAIGSMPALLAHDPLLAQALQTNKLCHVSQVATRQPSSQYLVAAPLLDLGGNLYGMLLVHEMPFFSLQEETLQTINLLLGYYTDGLSTTALAAPVLAAVPQCPADFAFEAQRLAHVQRSTRIASVIVVLSFLPRASERDLPRQILHLRRALDEAWLHQGSAREVLAVLMPLGSQASAQGYVARIEQWFDLTHEQSMAEAGVSVHVVALDADSPLAALQRVVHIANGHA
jgi:hypothetical protein